jgi:hypothetical protein
MNELSLDINNFCRNPNLKSWDKLPENIKSFFLGLFKYVKKTGNTGLASVINNIKNYSSNINTIQRPKYIFGVRQITYMESEKYGMKICLLDDSHTLDYSCKNSDACSGSDFIKQQVFYAPCFVDVFLEIPYLYSPDQEILYANKSYMGELQQGKFGQCFKWSKKDCKYYNLRSHHINLRNNDFLFDTISNFFSNIFYKTDVKPPDENFKEKVREIFADKNTLTQYLRNVASRTKINKQIESIKSEEIKEKVIRYFDLWLNIPPDINFKFLNAEYILNVIDKLTDDKEDNSKLVSNIYYSITGYAGVLMDIYTIARMFREYRQVEYKNSSNAKNIFVYAGGFHIRRYTNFLRRIGSFSVVHESTKSNANCVNNPFPDKIIF